MRKKSDRAVENQLGKAAEDEGDKLGDSEMKHEGMAAQAEADAQQPAAEAADTEESRDEQ